MAKVGKTQEQFFRLLLAVFLLPPLLCAAAPVSVHNLRLWQAPDNTRLVFDLSGPLEHRLNTLSDPERIVIEMDNARLEDGLAALDVSQSYIAAIRAVEPANGKLRITLELKRPVRPKSFVLRPAGQYGHRLVIDLNDEAVATALPDPESRAAPPTYEVLAPRDLVVAIDAGHGGEDPGAIGRRYRTHEKDVVLAIARELYKLVAAEPGMKPVMIRDGDYFIPLQKRTLKARNNGAHVFISIHADAVRGRHARGSSVYALSDRGASSALAKSLADDGNSSDWIGGVGREDLDTDVQRLLGDLGKDATIGDSMVLGGDMLGSMRSVGPLHSARVGQAGFMVLKSPIPSVLIETAFISNPEEERKLRDRAFQQRMARSIFSGLKRAAPRLLARLGTSHETMRATAPASAPIPSTQAAQAVPLSHGREHVVKPGETLSAIARLYDIHVETLRFLNGIQGSDLAVGTKLQVPARSGEL
jgi:N-acetylmuramoyl-L-alanine amidase